jgi:transcriptional regulator with XRE-family HTH domain
MADVPDITTAVARTLQALRADRGWSLDQLAARSGVSKGVLVALEQGRSNPNLATLARIGDAFGVPVTLLVDMGGEPAVRVSSPDASRILWRGPAGGTGTIIGATDPPWAVELWRWEMMPGEEFGGDAHAPATREMVWVEAGRLTLTIAGERHAVEPGQCARFPASRPHRYSNEGGEPVRLTMVVVIPPAQGLSLARVPAQTCPKSRGRHGWPPWKDQPGSPRRTSGMPVHVLSGTTRPLHHTQHTHYHTRTIIGDYSGFGECYGVHNPLNPPHSPNLPQ